MNRPSRVASTFALLGALTSMGTVGAQTTPASDLAARARRIHAEAIVLVFPTWWFGFPAILKGWFDRVWAPGVAYDHASDLGPIKPRLGKPRRMLAITTLGSPWWVDLFVLWQPIKRVLRIALLGACARDCRFEMLSLYKAESLAGAKVERFRSKIRATLGRWA